MPMSQINVSTQVEDALEQLQALREERNFFNALHKLSSGEHRNVEIYSAPVDVGGKLQLLSIVHDVTERKRAESELRNSEEQYRLTFEQAAIGMVHSRKFAG